MPVHYLFPVFVWFVVLHCRLTAGFCCVRRTASYLNVDRSINVAEIHIVKHFGDRFVQFPSKSLINRRRKNDGSNDAEASNDPLDQAKLSLKDMDERMTKSCTTAEESLSSCRPGKASPAVLERLPIEYLGSSTRIRYVSDISSPSTTSLVIKPHDDSMTQRILDVLNDADLGMGIIRDGKYIKLTMLPLTLERRNGLIKQVKTIVEDGKIAVRNIRRTTVDSIRQLEKKSFFGKRHF